MTLQEQMLNFRARHNLSQHEAAKRAMITLQTWNQVERGMQNPSRVTEAKIKYVIGEGENDRNDQQN